MRAIARLALFRAGVGACRWAVVQVSSGAAGSQGNLNVHSPHLPISPSPFAHPLTRSPAPLLPCLPPQDASQVGNWNCHQVSWEQRR
ncbi:hypothetical protein MiSe_66240 [Microseira wollei NIES-4236]|uniref:Secreted protein n=1 Tax=Microseira wollei NIES-4236 TaxID=2530354 RepID=A0AAV3XIU0_9CYAN|nr:hypothetical protein MiSe_66240 [Microseira wollei NIES-4236]